MSRRLIIAIILLSAGNAFCPACSLDSCFDWSQRMSEQPNLADTDVLRSNQTRGLNPLPLVGGTVGETVGEDDLAVFLAPVPTLCPASCHPASCPTLDPTVCPTFFSRAAPALGPRVLRSPASGSRPLGRGHLRPAVASRVVGLVAGLVAGLSMIAFAGPGLAQGDDNNEADRLPIDQFGAIAYSPREGIHGYGYNYPTKEAAEDAALQACRSRGGQACRLLIWFGNACGALAESNDRFGYAWSLNRLAAESEAVAKCGGGCTLTQSVCTGTAAAGQANPTP